jgi:PKD repeat protein
MKTARGTLLSSALGLLLSAAGLDAATYLPLSDQDLARRSPIILRALVKGSAVRVDNVDGKDLPFTITTLQPIEALKGSIGEGAIQVRLPGGRVDDQAWWLPGTPVFTTGQEVLVFLEPRKGHPGEYHVSEFGLGHFDILRDSAGRRFGVRPAFEPAEDLYLATLGPEPGAISPERAVLRRDADSLMAMVRGLARPGPAQDVALAAPSGNLRGPLEARPEWVNIGGTEPGNLFKWFWPSPSPNGVVAASGTQSNLSDGTDGKADVASMVAQWAGVAGSDVHYSSGLGGNVIVSLDVDSQPGGWTTPMACGTAGVVGLGGPGSASFVGAFKGDTNYFAPSGGNVWIRHMCQTLNGPGTACLPGGTACYNAALFQNVVLHEMGHTLGLGHPDEAASIHSSPCPFNSCGAVMRSVVTGVTTPQGDDIAGIQWYYGTAGPVPTAAFSFLPPSPTVNQTVTFTDASTGSPTSWSWNFGDSSTSTLQSPTHAFAASGTYNVSLTASNANGPSAPVSHPVAVSGPPTANFTFSPPSPTTGQTVSFTDTSTGTPPPTTYSWNFGDPASGGANTSTLQNPTHIFASANTYSVSHTATNTSGTSTPVVKSVVVSLAAPPTASFTFSPFSPVTGQTVFFTDTSTGSPAPTSWAWNFGEPASGAFNTSTQQFPTHAFASAGTFSVTLTATNAAGPSAPVSHSLTVSTPGAPPSAAFVFSPGTPLPGQVVSFTDTSIGGPTSWLWTFGDSFFAFTANPSHAYGSAGTYTVSLMATNNFGSTQTSQTVLVSAVAVPSASFTFSPSAPQPGQSVSFTDTSSATPTGWTWDFGDGGSSSLRNPSHTYIGAGNYTARLTASNLAGSSQASQSVSVHVSTPCSFDPGTLPANAGHNFCITLSARDPRTGHVGPGVAIPQNDLFGYFSIPALTSNPDNPEVFVKVLDGRVVNGFFWVFYGGLTDLEYTLSVRDFQTGVTRQYAKPAFSADGGFDTVAFSGVSSTVDPPSVAATTGSAAAPVSAGCSGDAATLCLNSSHAFFVSLSARDQRTGKTGPGLAIPQNNIFGYFSIPALTSNPGNPEVFVKVLDGTPVNGHYWVFFGGLTDLEYTITVREISTGHVRTYFKPAGSAAGGFDTSAF